MRLCSKRGPLFYKAHFPLSDCLRGWPPQPEATGSFTLRKKKEETPSIICVDCEQRVRGVAVTISGTKSVSVTKSKMAFDIATKQDYQRTPFSNRKPTIFRHAYH